MSIVDFESSDWSGNPHAPACLTIAMSSLSTTTTAFSTTSRGPLKKLVSFSEKICTSPCSLIFPFSTPRTEGRLLRPHTPPTMADSPKERIPDEDDTSEAPLTMAASVVLTNLPRDASKALETAGNLKVEKSKLHIHLISIPKFASYHKSPSDT